MFYLVFVDDDADDIFFLTEAFKKTNPDIDIVSFTDSEDAFIHLFKLCPEKFPAAVITDLNMPKLNGLELLQRLKFNKDLKHIPVIISSNSSLDNNRAGCMESGAQAYFVKPYTLSQYLQMVESILELLRTRVAV